MLQLRDVEEDRLRSPDFMLEHIKLPLMIFLRLHFIPVIFFYFFVCIYLYVLKVLNKMYHF